MVEGKRALQIAKTVACAGVCALTVSSCISANDSGTVQVTPQGTVQLENVKAGMPEQIFKGARITFAVDTHSAASSGNKTQYISRTYTAKNGQYMAQCKEDKCYELQVLYHPSVSKADAMATLKQIAPADAAEPVVDETVLKNKNATRADELYYFSNKYLGIISYDDKSGKLVNMVSLYALPPQIALKFEYGRGAANIKLPESAKSDAVAEAAPSGSATEH